LNTLSDLTGSRWELLEQKDGFLRIRVVSALFEGQRITVRIPKVSELFFQRSKPLTEEFGLIIEAWTEAELLKIQKGEEVSTDNLTTAKAAAAARKNESSKL
jgi:hypothetical protein